MYLSPAVRAITENPTPEASVTLRITLVENHSEETKVTVRDTVETLNGSVDASLPYRGYTVTIPEPAVAELCSLSGIEAIETHAVLDPGDSGEDVNLDQGAE